VVAGSCASERRRARGISRRTVAVTGYRRSGGRSRCEGDAVEGDEQVGSTAGTPVSDTVAVLVASADAGTRAQVALTLGHARFEVMEAADTDAAIRRVAVDRPPLLVLDAALPGAGALALARTVRSQPETLATRVLVLTDRGQPPADASDAVDATLAAPFTAFALLRKVETLLAGEARPA
jgi:CheY-like chemotaxis protein